MSAVNIELLPCPFCGGEAKLELTTQYYTGEPEMENAFIRCMKCGVWTDEYVYATEAAAAWNARHVETCTIGDYKDPDYGYTHDAMWNDEWFVPSGRCSGCGEYIPVWNYCPKCGRKVEG